MKRTFTCTEGGSNKFWDVEWKGNTFTTWWGKIGTTGQTKTQTLADETKAQKEYEKLVNEKLRKGYIETTPAGGPAVPPPAAKKAEPAPAPPPTPAKKEAPAPAVRTFAYSDATSHKFWNIEFKGTSFTVTYGRQGTAGQQQTKTFADEAKARKEHDKLVTEKAGKGYKETTPRAKVPTNIREALEDALVEHPDDLSSYMAYADYLGEQGDPLGEFIRVQLQLEDEKLAPAERKKLQQQEKKLLNKHAATWLGDLAPFLLRDEGAEEGVITTYQFRRGWLDSLTANNFSVEFMRALARAPQTRLLRRLELGEEAYEEAGTYESGDDIPEVEDDRVQLFPLIRSPHLTNVRVFILGEPIQEKEDHDCTEYGPSNCHTSGAAAVGVVKQMPRLEELYLLAHNVDNDQLFALKTLHHLRVLQVDHCMNYPLAKLAKNPSLGNVTHLLFHPHAVEDVEDDGSYLPPSAVKALVHTGNLPSLTHLRLRCSNGGDKGMKEIVDSGILKRLKMLDLRHGCVTDKGAEKLAACPDLTNLESLDLVHNCLTTVGVKILQNTGVNLDARSQWDPATTDEGEGYLYAGDIE